MSQLRTKYNSNDTHPWTQQQQTILNLVMAAKLMAMVSLHEGMADTTVAQVALKAFSYPGVTMNAVPLYHTALGCLGQPQQVDMPAQ